MVDPRSGKERIGVIIEIFEQYVRRRESHRDMRWLVRWLRALVSVGARLLKKNNIEVEPGELCLTDAVKEQNLHEMQGVHGRELLAYDVDDVEDKANRMLRRRRTGLVQDQTVRLVRYGYSRKGRSRKLRDVDPDWLDKEE